MSFAPIGANTVEGADKVSVRVFRRYFPLILILWILFVLYPHPAKLFISIHRVIRFEIDTGAVAFMLSELPSEPAAIEAAILAKIPYAYDWVTYGVPWYFPTVEETLRKGKGDCKARALVLASVLEAKNIPYRIHASPIHTWVSYESKTETSLENSRVEWYKFDPETGDRQFQIPDIDVKEVVDSYREAFWHPMPGLRKGLLISGSLVLIAARVVLRKKKPVTQVT